MPRRGRARRPPLPQERTYDKGAIAVWSFIASEAGFFLILIIAFVFFNFRSSAAGPSAASVLDVQKTAGFTVCLFASSVTLWLSEKRLDKKDVTGATVWLLLTLILGGVFIVGQGNEYLGLFHRGVGVATNLFATTFFTLTGFHGLHVTVGLFALAIALALVRAADFRARAPSLLKAIGLYWHFVDVVWLVVFTIVYLRPLS